MKFSEDLSGADGGCNVVAAGRTATYNIGSNKKHRYKTGRQMTNRKHKLFQFPEVGVPYLWPFAFFIGLEGKEMDVIREDLKFLEEVGKTQIERPEPEWATRNKVILELDTMNLRDFSSERRGPAMLILAPP
jgi:hypothetical protein